VKDERGDRIVVWANAVSEARYCLTVPEQRLILWLATQIERKDDALKDWTVSVQEMQAIAGGSDGGAVYGRFKEACDRLLTRKLALQLDDRGWVRGITWMRHVDYNDRQGTIRLRFHDDLAPVLLKLKERFSMIPLKTVFQLRGGYAIRWYELLVGQAAPGDVPHGRGGIARMAGARGARVADGERPAGPGFGRAQEGVGPQSGPLLHLPSDQGRPAHHRLDVHGETQPAPVGAQAARAVAGSGTGAHRGRKASEPGSPGRIAGATERWPPTGRRSRRVSL
jgi:hypothetical protein